MADKKGIAYFGPWVGELGWELMAWQAWCREQSKSYKKSYICSFPDMAPLYTDFAEFIPHTFQPRMLKFTKKWGFNFDRVEFTVPKDVTNHIWPIWKFDSGGDFIRFGKRPNSKYRFIIHARGIKTHRQSRKNYPSGYWQEVVKGLPGEAACIGTEEDKHIEGTTDLRGIPFDEVMDYMAGAALVIGGSSGPMCLSLLCGTPIMAWGPAAGYHGGTLKKRFTKQWNPFGIRVHFMSVGWKPSPKSILEGVNTILGKPRVQDPVPKKSLIRDSSKPKDVQEVLPLPSSIGELLHAQDLKLLCTTAQQITAKTFVSCTAGPGPVNVVLGHLAKQQGGKLYSVESADLPEWYKAMEKFDLTGFSELLVEKSLRSQPGKLSFDKPVDYLLIDARHEPAHVITRLRCWKRLVRPEGRVAIYRYVSAEGAEYIEDITIKFGRLNHLGRVGSVVLTDGKPRALMVFRRP